MVFVIKFWSISYFGVGQTKEKKNNDTQIVDISIDFNKNWYPNNLLDPSKPIADHQANTDFLMHLNVINWNEPTNFILCVWQIEVNEENGNKKTTSDTLSHVSWVDAQEIALTRIQFSSGWIANSKAKESKRIS